MIQNEGVVASQSATDLKKAIEKAKHVSPTDMPQPAE